MSCLCLDNFNTFLVWFLVIITIWRVSHAHAAITNESCSWSRSWISSSTIMLLHWHCSSFLPLYPCHRNTSVVSFPRWHIRLQWIIWITSGSNRPVISFPPLMTRSRRSHIEMVSTIWAILSGHSKNIRGSLPGNIKKHSIEKELWGLTPARIFKALFLLSHLKQLKDSL